jgi:hypothetical protein
VSAHHIIGSAEADFIFVSFSLKPIFFVVVSCYFRLSDVKNDRALHHRADSTHTFLYSQNLIFFIIIITDFLMALNCRALVSSEEEEEEEKKAER